MSKILVIYDSLTGNTEKMAQAVIEGINLVKGVESEIIKVGTPFSISKLTLADAIIFGSPTRYGNVTSEMNAFLDAVKELKQAKKLEIAGKMGGAFGSYVWDGGWVTYKLEADMKELGINIVASAVSAVDSMGAMRDRISDEWLQKCRELGKTIAEKLTQ